MPFGTAATTRSRYATACGAVVIGGLRLGMMIARPNCAAVCGTTVFSAAPSRTWRCQSSGRVRVICCWLMGGILAQIGGGLPYAEDAEVSQRTQKEVKKNKKKEQAQRLCSFR